MPIIAGHAGNTGTQAVTLVVRGLAIGEVRVSDLLTIVRKELAFGFVHGIVAGGVTALLAFILSFNPWMALVVWAALLGNVIIAGLAGALIPLGVRRLGFDPAVASAIWLTTFTDIIGFLMLLGLGTLLLDRLS
jgi:magnesium transporter